MTQQNATTSREFNSLAEFYPFYLSEHSNSTSRRLHFVGTSLVIAITLYAVFSQHWATLWFLPLVGYSFAWVGHYFFEHNRPATFKHPLYSLSSDFIMLKDIATGRIPW